MSDSKPPDTAELIEVRFTVVGPCGADTHTSSFESTDSIDVGAVRDFFDAWLRAHYWFDMEPGDGS